ncbi:S9 family peptidase [Segetibacter sp. 3557_3]|uniref:S9 family peptidase n=1 Tax=Segetibacter sp. 3557_3 TaxID=2547429 RepID=UPI0010588842|nr:prolyl oligopeptidase family serine peptidase [Segetibacter sp. 3557_3]TDH27838.1 S9 family peptidase [Segetibacter sp. 3557_3]
MRQLVPILFLFITVHLHAQDAVTYQTPPKAMADILLAPPTPVVSIDDHGKFMLLSERSSYPTVEDLAQPELRIAGMRINPNTYGASRSVYSVNFRIKNLATGAEAQVKGLPANLEAGIPQWSPSRTKIAFSNTTANGIDLYVIDVASQQAKKLNKTFLNNVLDNFHWEDDNTIWYTATTKPSSAMPARPLAPKGPVVQQNLGKTAASATYQDLIKSPYDEQLFEFYGTGQLIRNVGGTETQIGKPAIYNSITLSPDKKYLLVNRIEKPFSYLVPSSGFPSTTLILDKSGKEIKALYKSPGRETAPRGFDNVQNTPSRYEWRDDESATICWTMPLDSGLYKNTMEFHDAVYALSAPFSGTPKELVKTNYRFRNIQWGNSTFALVTEGLQREQKVRISRFNPQTGELQKLIERSTNDAYNNPGTPNTVKNVYGRDVVQLLNNGTQLLMSGPGASEKGEYPFLATFDLATLKTNIIWRSADPYYESVVNVVDGEKKIFVTSRQSQTEPPNYYIRDLSNNTSKAITNFKDPQPALRKVKKEKIFYKRKDGVDLTATLYTPEGYDAKRDGPLPVFMWAYPREFKSAADAGQVRGSQNTFTRLGSGSCVFLVTQGYAVMDETEFPIVGEGTKYPNDNFVEQLEWNAAAAIDKVVAMGVGDRNRVGIGGHSYGAFMTANLLAHTRLFKAGIARSGAYNRTLTPFGFQNEERTFWQAPEVYTRMSPFAYANNIKDAILLIHGEADNNPGTFPIQSERLYNAIKGHGGTVRYVVLPYESHGYTGKENLLHMLWEMNEWLTKYLKPTGKQSTNP